MTVVDLRKAMLPEGVERAEQGLLGAILLHPRYLRDLPELEVEHFAHLKHRVVFAAFRALEAESRPIDVLSTELEIERQGKLDAIGGVAFLGELAIHVPIPEHFFEYARVVKDFALKRRVMLLCGDIVERARNTDISGDELLNDASKSFAAIDGVKADTVSTIGELAKRRVADFERIAAAREAGENALTGAPTGIRSLDAKLGGWQFEIVNVIAARPGMGKSAAALATADACSEGGVGVHVFSLEDSWHAYTDRALARRSGVAAVSLRRADFPAGDTSKIGGALLRLIQRDGWLVDDRGGLTASEIVRAARRAADKNKTRVAIVDYIQLVKPRDARMTEYQHLGDAMGTFAEAAKVDGMAYLVLCQLNRKLEERNDKRPQLSDLRGSGELEEKCKVAVALYRGSYYGGKPKRDVDYECGCPEAVRACAIHAPSLDAWERQVQCIVLKGGNGPTGSVMANWNGPTVEIW